jgi:type I restriction enzyme M protein
LCRNPSFPHIFLSHPLDQKTKKIEETLWQSCDKLRGSIEPAEYKHVVLGLIFLKFASDKFEQRKKECST